MMKHLGLLCIFCWILTACQPVPVPISQVTASAAETATVEPPTAAPTITLTAAPTITLTAAPTETPTLLPTETSTPEPDGLIRVDTLEQEIYPFDENGRCSLSEAIYAANLQKVVDTCAPGGEESSVIELMPGTYRLTQLDQTPQQVEWAFSTTGTGNALPAVVRTLTLRGSGAVLSREDAGEPFRILEVLAGTLTIEDVTLQGGEVREEDWGGAMLVQHASLVMDGVSVLNSKAENGGGVYFTDGGLTIRDSFFAGNSASFSGGGLYAGQTKAEITGSRFHDNFADGYGGGVYVQDAFVTVSDCVFIANRSESRGGGINLQIVNGSVLRSQFYRNYANISGAGVSGRNYIYEEDIAQAEEDPLERLMQTDTYIQLATQVPGFQETLIAHPSGMYLQRDLDIQVHENCFLGNTDLRGDPLEAATAIAGLTDSQNNYYGDPSGPSGMGDGSGDSVGGMVAFEPWLTESPEHCDLSLAEE